jgi:toxin HigB-1
MMTSTVESGMGRYLLRNDSPVTKFVDGNTSMDFSFATRRLRRELSDEGAMKRAYGERSRPLKNRLSVLAEAQSLAEVPRGPPDWLEQLKGDRDEQFSVVLTKNWRLIFEIDHDPIPRREDGGIALDRVTAIRFIEVVDYHGK